MVFLELSGETVTELTAKKALWSWWMNPVSKSSMRLTEAGSEFLTNDLKLASYKYTINKECDRTHKVLLQLDKHLSVPFFLGPRRSIIFYGEKDAIMLGMMDSNLNAYLDNLSQ